MNLIEQVREKMKKDGLSVNKLSFLIGLSNGYISKLLNGKRRITERVKRIFEDYISGEYDGIEIPRHADDRLQRIYLQGYNQAIRDMKEFINLKKTDCYRQIANSRRLIK
ncbi:helix-turn-helix domain-containing protein [Staphylococcus haemolyticus]|uniref:helix-turn-helix domain-containing protein n=1 Tax=Staphylococcus haemolyticus TaxID=1283 RepID=UPI0007580A7B|nr:helix-turn-helix transcriptional regulator [Staphylococcus haemolyticus]